VCFLQLPSAVVTADFNGFVADFDFDGIAIQLAVASRTSRFHHGIALPYPKSECESSKPCRRRCPLSESLAIFSDIAGEGVPTQHRAPELRGRAAIGPAEGRAEMTVARESEVQAQSGQVLTRREKIQRPRQS
jgi:hypothetical protein